MPATGRDGLRRGRPASGRLAATAAVAMLAAAVAFTGQPRVRAAAGALWVSPGDLAVLPAAGPAWGNLLAAADDLGVPDIADQDSRHDVATYAAALVYARTEDPAYRARAAEAVMAAIGTEQGTTSEGGKPGASQRARSLALGRNLVSYVLAADLIGLRAYSEADDDRFRAWLAGVIREVNAEGRTLIECHEVRPNNWGTHCGASRIAADLYLGDAADLTRAAGVFRGWLGDRSVYAGFVYGSDLSWQWKPLEPVGINASGATKEGHSIDGVLPDDQRRTGRFTWPPPQANYVYEALQGALVQAVLLHRAGYGALEWEDRAIFRAYDWLHEQALFPAAGDDVWQMWVVNAYYGTQFPASSPASPGKNMGWTDWTHGGPPPPPPVAGFTATPTAGDAPLVVSFTDASTGSPTSWAWDFGDGGTSTSRNPTYTYAAAGSYPVSLTVANISGSDDEVKAAYVTVAPVRAFTATEDAYLSSKSATKNYGTATTLRVRTASSGTRYRSYLKFTVSGLTAPPASATLRLWVTDPSSDGGSAYVVDPAAWTERTITWRTAPATGGAAVGSAGAVTAGTWTEIDLGGVVSGNGTYSFALVQGADGDAAFYDSREAANDPQLVISP